MAYIPQYISRKHGKEIVTYDLPEMQEILEETYGITVYQEQVMLLSQKLAGFSKGQADILRKAMGKKDKKTLDKMKAGFLEGAMQKITPRTSWKRSGQTGKHLHNTPSINRTPPAIHWLRIRRPG